MDSNDSFSTFYPNYFNNQATSLGGWTPNQEENELNIERKLKENIKDDEEYDYQVLVESIFNKGSENILTGIEEEEEIQKIQTPSKSFLKNINWSDFDDYYLTKSLTKQFAKTSLKGSQSEFLNQLQTEWQSKNNVNQNKVSGDIKIEVNGTNNNMNSMFSRILEEGYETRLNSSRSSDKSTNRTNMTGSGGGIINNQLLGTFGFKGIGGTQLINESLISQQMIKGNLNTGTLNANLQNLNNINSQIMRNHIINNQLLNRQILNNQMISPQIMSSQNIYPNQNMASTYRSMTYNNEYMVNGQFGGNEFGTPDYMTTEYGPNSYNMEANGMPMNLYEYHGYGCNKYCRAMAKGQYYKNYKNKQMRKKRTKTELFPLPSLKDGEFEKAVNYLKETLMSLYRDQIIPIYFNVRGRFIEHNAEEIAPEHILDICKRKPEIFNVVSNGALNETFIYLVKEPEWFKEWVDRNDLKDVYNPKVWEEFFNFIKNYKDEEGNEQFPGSIYGMSRLMRKLNLKFIEGMSLGTVCHIVQLAIRVKKYLVYDLKTLKASDLVKNGQFHNLPESIGKNAQIVESLRSTESSIKLSKMQNTVSGGKSEKNDKIHQK